MYSVVTAADMLLLRCWHDHATKKRKEAEKQIPITDSMKNKLFHLEICIVLNAVFVCQNFSFDAMYFFII
jgi:hypothetical protein